MGIALFLVGVLGAVVSLIILLVQAIRKKTKKVAVILCICFVAVSFIGFLIADNTPAIDVVKGSHAQIMAGELLDAPIIEIRGDVVTIERMDNGLYAIEFRASDGTYMLYTTEDVAGGMPREGDMAIKAYVATSALDDGEIVVTAVSFPKK